VHKEVLALLAMPVFQHTIAAVTGDWITHLNVEVAGTRHRGERRIDNAGL